MSVPPIDNPPVVEKLAPVDSGRDNHLWLQLWRDNNQAGFHQEAVNPLLTRFWPGLDLPRRSRVFIPLCGKSLDMIWLAQQGHEVIGVELSPIAVKAFFRENGLKPTRRKQGGFTQWRHGRITILCGDYFSLTKKMLGDITAVYDRAALTALPHEVRVLYVEKLRRIVSRSTGVFLLTVEEMDEDEKAEAHVDKELISLYAADFDIELAHVESVWEPDPAVPGVAPQRVEYKFYRLSGCAS